MAQPQYDLAVAYRILNARTERAKLLAPVAVAHCLAHGLTAAQLLEAPEKTWLHLADLIGMTRRPKAETRAIVVRMVNELLPHACPACGRGRAAGQLECLDCTAAHFCRPVLVGG